MQVSGAVFDCFGFLDCLACCLVIFGEGLGTGSLDQ